MPPKPSTFEPEWLDLLMYLAYTVPEVTSNWQHFCKGLVLQSTGECIFPTQELLNYAREKLNRFKTHKGSKRDEFNKSYNPFDSLLKIDPSIHPGHPLYDIMSRARNSPMRSRSTKDEADDAAALLAKASTSPFPSITAGDFDMKVSVEPGATYPMGTYVEYSLTNQKTPNGKTSYSIIRLIVQLPPCLINETTKDEQNGIQAKLVNIGSTSKKNRTGVLVTCPFSAEGVLKDLPAILKRNAQVWGMNGLLDEETSARLRDVVHDESTKSFRILYILPECDDKFEHCNEDFNFFFNPSTEELEIPPLPNQLLPLIKAFNTKSGQGRGYVSFTIPLKGSEISLVKKEARKPVAASIYSNLSDDDEVWKLRSFCIFLL